MCGIVAAVSDRDIVPVLVQGLQRLEYRGYDSAALPCRHSMSSGLESGPQVCPGSTARVAELMEQVKTEHVGGLTGIAHTAGLPMVNLLCATLTYTSVMVPAFRLWRMPMHPPEWHWCTTASSRTTKPA